MQAKSLSGKVISTKMSKTLVVRVGFSKKHSRYNKSYTVHSNFKVHCEDVSKFKLGQVVSIIQCAPKSKTKNWIVLESPKKSKVSKEKA